MIKGYNRRKIPPGIDIPWGQIGLTYTDHARNRMADRTKGSLSILPKMILLSTKNLKQIWTEDVGGKESLKSMLVEIPYTKGTLLQLIISHNLTVITLYFREVWQHAKHVESRVLESTAGDTSPDPPLEDPVRRGNLPNFSGNLKKAS